MGLQKVLVDGWLSLSYTMLESLGVIMYASLRSPQVYFECLDGHGQINQHGKGVFVQSVWFLH